MENNKILKFLCVDDEPDVCDLVADAIESRGHVAISAQSFSAFSREYRKNFDCIIIDLMMPDVDGIEIIRFLSDNNWKSNIVLMSGHDIHLIQSAGRMAQGKGIRVLGLLQKPFSLCEIDKLICELELQIKPEITNIPSWQQDSPNLTENDIVSAIACGEIVAYFQPKFCPTTKRHIGSEALARWVHPVRGMIRPDLFIQLAERTGHIKGITDAVIDYALEGLSRFVNYDSDMTLSINLSPAGMDDLEFPDKMAVKCGVFGVSPENIIFEVTETEIPKDESVFFDILMRLRLKKFGLSIDDFGTGHSSLRQLQVLPFTELKIDQSFFRNSHQFYARTIIESSSSLAHRLGLSVVAEGIETDDQLQLCRKLNCDSVQGYLLSKPIPREEYLNFINKCAVLHG
jgi:EAL domain-containing protein (putative c-di-GMP-specific phosphodiesterase class I)/DNA-binding NarL/FixJ family response regulator